MFGRQVQLKVTVLISVFSGAAWLQESIESILEQSFANFEFIIVDNGSQDSSLELIGRYAAFDYRIRVIDKPNAGLTFLLNVGILAARGEWIVPIDADDIAMSNGLAMQLDCATRDERCVVLGSGMVRIDDKGREVGAVTFPSDHSAICCWTMLKLLSPFPHTSSFIRTAAIHAVCVGGIETDFADRSIMTFGCGYPSVELSDRLIALLCVFENTLLKSRMRMAACGNWLTGGWCLPALV